MNWNITQIKKMTDEGSVAATVSFVVSNGINTLASDAYITGAAALQITGPQVTEQICVDAVKAAIGTDMVSSYEQKVVEIAGVVQPETVPLPWENS
jgi:hypothetical protein